MVSLSSCFYLWIILKTLILVQMLHIWGCITSDCPHRPPSTMEATSYEWKKVALSDKWRIILPHVWGSAGMRMHYRKKAKLAMLCWETLDSCGIDLHSPRNSEKLNLWFTCRDKFNKSPYGEVTANPFPLLGASLGVIWCVTSIVIRLPVLAARYLVSNPKSQWHWHGAVTPQTCV